MQDDQNEYKNVTDDQSEYKTVTTIRANTKQ